MPRPEVATATVLLLLSASVFGCATPVKTQDNLDAKVISMLGVSYTVAYNTSKTFALYEQSRVNDHPNRSFKYIVVRLADREVVTKGSYRGGYVKWLNNTSIEVASASKGDSLERNVVQVEETQL